MVEILKSNISDTESIADILASYLYLRDIYGLNNEQLEYIASPQAMEPPIFPAPMIATFIFYNYLVCF